MITKTKYKKTSELNLKAQVYKFNIVYKNKSFPSPVKFEREKFSPYSAFSLAWASELDSTSSLKSAKLRRFSWR